MSSGLGSIGGQECGQSPQYQEKGCDIGTKAYRRTSWDVLSDLVSAARLRANQLEALQRALPQELSYVADEALVRTFERELNLYRTGVLFG